jgi:hypothetical protein
MVRMGGDPVLKSIGGDPVLKSNRGDPVLKSTFCFWPISTDFDRSDSTPTKHNTAVTKTQ